MDSQITTWKKLSGEGLNLEYAEHFIGKKEADKFFQRLEAELKYFTGNLAKVRVYGKWRDVPRQQVAFGDPGLKYKFSGNSIPALVWPDLIKELKEKVETALGMEYNFVLVNRYRDGKDHIGEHRDDEGELDKSVGIASLSLGQVRDFVLKHIDSRGKMAKRNIPPVKIALGHGSLLIMKQPTNTYWYHSLPPRKSLLGARINLTFRKIVNQKDPN